MFSCYFWRGGVAALLFRKGGLPRWFPVGTVKSFGEPHRLTVSLLGWGEVT